MKRLHVNLKVKELEESVRFYSTLFDAAPTVTKPNYAKWMLDDPRVNFSIVAAHRSVKSATRWRWNRRPTRAPASPRSSPPTVAITAPTRRC